MVRSQYVACYTAHLCISADDRLLILLVKICAQKVRACGALSSRLLNTTKASQTRKSHSTLLAPWRLVVVAHPRCISLQADNVHLAVVQSVHQQTGFSVNSDPVAAAVDTGIIAILAYGVSSAVSVPREPRCSGTELTGTSSATSAEPDQAR